MSPRAESAAQRGLELAVDGLAVSRIARLIVDDEITKPGREYVLKHWGQSWWAPLVDCRACVSVWASGVLLTGLVPRQLRALLALSAVAVIVERLVDQRGQVESGWD